MSLCKTAALGGHREGCNNCGYTRIHYNSCGNRNCPTCQGVNKEKWIISRQQDLLPVKYFHAVFTIPGELYGLFRYNKRPLYDLLMRGVKDTLLDFGKDHKHGVGSQIGAICILHTWTQQMTFHPHVHCIVPAGGVNGKGQWKHSKGKGKFLFPVKAMSRLLRGKLMAGIHQLYKAGNLNMSPQLKASYKTTKNRLYKKEWVVYAKKAFGGPDQVLEYLGRYTHKICISNYRILNITDTHVTFRYTDRRANKIKVRTIRGEKFILHFAEHILPKRFVKIRHIGFLSSRVKSQKIILIRKCLGMDPPPPLKEMDTRELIKITTGKDPFVCPKCGQGELVIIQIIPRIRGSPHYQKEIKMPYRVIPKYRKVRLCQV